MQKLPFYLPMIEDDEESVFESWPNGQRTHDKLSSGLLRFIQEIARKSELTSQIERDRFGNQRLAFYANGCETPYYVTEDFLFASTQAHEATKLLVTALMLGDSKLTAVVSDKLLAKLTPETRTFAKYQLINQSAQRFMDEHVSVVVIK
ncbi:hypothetical protein [Lacticaseibacillus paracasei]|jgi:hypothetical protein|uniref:hypothetical protein n=1 Tax=Lacticaseibacillus paracasei TaxID=1597 RepID=UPI0008DE2963|nr:hypothetical protein [Lacticaseibacillus paracasei]MBF4176058.1 hypothetical protein [Lacticaseibacillus paracasei subsp. tolerans]OHY45510.1 hypothetical protein BBX46_14050 [Lacticaseibacillus paracasei]QPC20521.1 hypothetical protein LacP0734_15755 [Lacticaseibacillus paracasei subsp. tolerans]